MENYLQYIDAYFNDELGAEEARKFEQRIIDDKSFAEEVAFYLSAKQTLREELIKEKKEWFRQLLAQNKPVSGGRVTPIRRLQFYRIAAAAAVFIFIILAGYLFFFRQSSPQQMAEKYIQQNMETLGVTMGKGDSLQNGLLLFNEGRLSSALEIFENIIERDSSNISAKRCAGIVYLRLGNYDRALAYFQQLEKYSLYSNPALFYQALTLLKRNQPSDKEKARQLLHEVVDKNLEEKETARKWLDKNWK